MSEVAPTTTDFIADQRRILGEVCRLALRWRRERLAVPADQPERTARAISELPAKSVEFRPTEEI